MIVLIFTNECYIGISILVQGFGGEGVWSTAPGIFLSFDFYPHSSSPSLEILSYSLAPGYMYSILLYNSRAYRGTCTVTSVYYQEQPWCTTNSYAPLTLQVLLLKTSILTGFSALDFKISFSVSLSWSCKICDKNISFHVRFLLNLTMHTHCMKIQSNVWSQRKTSLASTSSKVHFTRR